MKVDALGRTTADLLVALKAAKRADAKVALSAGHWADEWAILKAAKRGNW